MATAMTNSSDWITIHHTWYQPLPGDDSTAVQAAEGEVFEH